MADKFTRVGTVEGDIWYATTASSTKSIESLEDNIDDKLLTFLGEDNAGTSTTSTSETEIGEVTVSANTARNRILIFAIFNYSGSNNTGSSASSTFRIRTGTSATATSNTLRESISTDAGWDDTGSVQATTHTATLIATITSSDEVFTGNFFVHVTAQGSGTSQNTSTCIRLIVLGI